MTMKKNQAKPRVPDQDRDTMRPEYDFSKGVRGVTAARYREGTNVIVVDPSVSGQAPTAPAAAPVSPEKPPRMAVALAHGAPAPEEYAVAVQLAQYESQLNWTMMGVFLVPESVLLGFLGTALADNILRLATPALWVTSCVGLFVSVAWSYAFERGVAWYDLRIAQALRYEEERQTSRLLREAEILKDDRKITVGSKTVELPLLPGFTRRFACRRLIDIFAVIFGVGAVVSTLQLFF